MIPMTLFKKFLSLQFIASVEVCNMARCSGKSDKLRNINSIGCRARNITIEKWEIDNFKIKIVTFIVNFGRNNIIRNGQMQIQKLGFGIRGTRFIKISNISFLPKWHRHTGQTQIRL